ncbi:hypothetical protein ABI59_06275 [Acidobacteria bacterium Mor1]|nr:hypothetical protein ABI59_06275 [Acidobacteria bacterium Mor1]
MTLFLAGVYLVMLAGVGAWSARRVRGPRDYFIAGQRAGLWAVGLSTMSAAFSAFVFLGGPGLAYRVGAGSLFIALPVGFTAAFLCWTLARPLREMSADGSVFTVADVLARRFDDRRVQGLAACCVLAGVVGYLGLQLKALGVLFQSVFGISSLPLAVALGAAVILAYSLFGGMLAGLYTDVLQGAIMLAGAALLCAHAVHTAGGPDAVLSSVAGSEAFGPGFLDPDGRLPQATLAGFFLVFGVGVAGQPHMVHKFFMIADVQRLRFLPAIIGGAQSLCLLVWLGLGLAIPALVAQGRLAPVAQADKATLAYLAELAPAALAGVAMAALLAAIMSTADSFMNIGAAALMRDLPRALGRPLRDEVLAARGATVALTGVAAAFALAYGDLIAALGTFSFSTFAAGLAPVLLIGLAWPRVGAAAAGASIAVGTGLNLGLEFLARNDLFPGALGMAPGTLPGAVSLSVSFLILLTMTWLRPDPREESA